MQETWAILLAAGQGKRLKQNPGDLSKQFINYKGFPLFWHSAVTLSAVPAVQGLLFVFSSEALTYASGLVDECVATSPLGVPYKILTGGVERQDSVWNALEALPQSCTRVLVHDAARPFCSAALAVALLDALDGGEAGVIPGLEPADTIKLIDESRHVKNTPPRGGLRYVQTPQAFDRRVLVKAHSAARKAGLQVTDDASILEAAGIPVLIIPGETANCKITRPEDLEMLRDKNIAPSMLPCTGVGYDVHKYGGGRPFKLGGVFIESTDITIAAHSDGDVLLHALIDALLGCACAGDIGRHFPDNDARYDNINSAVLLAEVLELVRAKGLLLAHVDMTIIAQVPKIAPFTNEIVKNVAHLLHLREDQVNLKGTTEEGLGFTGAKHGIKAVAAVTALKPA